MGCLNLLEKGYLSQLSPALIRSREKISYKPFLNFHTVISRGYIHFIGLRHLKKLRAWQKEQFLSPIYVNLRRLSWLKANYLKKSGLADNAEWPVQEFLNLARSENIKSGQN